MRYRSSMPLPVVSETSTGREYSAPQLVRLETGATAAAPGVGVDGGISSSAS